MKLKVTRRIPVLERLWARTTVDPETGCWLLLDYALNRHGYVKVRDDEGRTRYAHRIAWLRFRGPIRGMDVHHECRVRYCWCPSHLELEPPEEHRVYMGWYR